MTSKELAIQEMKTELSKKKRQLSVLQSEISSLENSLEYFYNISDSFYDSLIEDCKDFPLHPSLCNRISLKIGTLYIRGNPHATLHDLIHSSPEDLLKIKGIGEKKLKMIEKWMEQHDLQFIF